jgi:hypothetical protein
MKCPACGNDMATGHLFCGGASIDWVCDEQPRWKKFLTIGNQHLTDFLGKLPAYHCARCGFLVLPHDKLKAHQ